MIFFLWPVGALCVYIIIFIPFPYLTTGYDHITSPHRFGPQGKTARHTARLTPAKFRDRIQTGGGGGGGFRRPNQWWAFGN